MAASLALYGRACISGQRKLGWHDRETMSETHPPFLVGVLIHRAEYDLKAMTAPRL